MSKEDFKNRSLPLPIKGMQTKSTLRVHLTPVRVIKIYFSTVEKREPSFIVRGTENCCSHSRNRRGEVSKATNTIATGPNCTTPCYRPKGFDFARHRRSLSNAPGCSTLNSQEMGTTESPSTEEQIMDIGTIHAGLLLICKENFR